MLILFCSGFLMLSGHSLTAEAKLKKPVIKSVTYEDVGDFRVVSNKNTEADGYELRYSRSSEFDNVKKVTVTVYKESNSDSAKEKLYYMDKVTMYENVRSSSSGVWKKLKVSGKTRYAWIASNDVIFTKKKNPYNYDAYVTTQFQEEVVAECLEFFKIEAIGTPTIMLNPGYESEWATYQVCGSDLDLNKLEPGDLVFFNEKNGTKHEFPWNHCGIYLGNGDFIHSSSFYNGVKITPLVDIYEDSFQMAIRVLPDSVTPINEVRTVTEVLSVYPNAKCHIEDRIAKIAKGETVTLLWTNEKHGYVCYEPGKYGFVLNPEDKLNK